MISAAYLQNPEATIGSWRRPIWARTDGSADVRRELLTTAMPGDTDAGQPDSQRGIAIWVVDGIEQRVTTIR